MTTCEWVFTPCGATPAWATGVQVESGGIGMRSSSDRAKVTRHSQADAQLLADIFRTACLACPKEDAADPGAWADGIHDDVISVLESSRVSDPAPCADDPAVSESSVSFTLDVPLSIRDSILGPGAYVLSPSMLSLVGSSSVSPNVTARLWLGPMLMRPVDASHHQVLFVDGTQDYQLQPVYPQVTPHDLAGALAAGSIPEGPRHRHRTNVVDMPIMVGIDPVSRALFERNSGALVPQDYWIHDTEDDPKLIDTGPKMQAALAIKASPDADMQDETTYMLNATDQFWMEAAGSLALQNQYEILGSDLLRLRGYKNPYQGGMEPIMSEAADVFMRLSSTKVWISTVGENKSYDGKLQVEYGPQFQSLVDCHVQVLRNRGHMDFKLTLLTTPGEEPLAAFPLLMYSKDKREMLLLSQEDFSFPTLRLRKEHRLMWNYILKRLRAKRAVNTILFDTMFRNIGMQDIDRNKRYKMLTMLMRMLDYRRQQGRLDYEWQRKGSRDHSVTITEPTGATA